MALVTSKSLPLCTATLVSPHAVLTTASCAGGKGEAEPKLVLVGAFNTHLDAFRRAVQACGESAAAAALLRQAGAACCRHQRSPRACWPSLLKPTHATSDRPPRHSIAPPQRRRKGKYEIKYVDRAILHPGFKPKDARHDNLALLVLTKPSKLDPVKLPAASFAYPPEASDAEVLGFGSLSSDGVWPQRHADELTLLPEAECSGLQTAYGPSPEGAVDQACTGRFESGGGCRGEEEGGERAMWPVEAALHASRC